MYNFEVSEHLQKILKKLSKKDKYLYNQVLKKIDEIIHSENAEHYKNLRYNMKDSKRVHISRFVLIFQYKKEKNLILFDDFDHHDNVYK
ncbi:MAG: type II toxin-antitoxin system RelE family toxin [Petrotogales bacterium]